MLLELTLFILLALGLLIWWVEPRFYVFWFQRFFYPVDWQADFIQPSKVFPQHSLLEANTDLFMQEVEQLIKQHHKVPKAHEVDAYNHEISFANGPGWRTFYLKVYSGWFEENCQQCPQTYAFFKDMPEVITIMYSIMEPGNVIPPHKGELRGFYRYQLPLQVPKQPGCVITVGNESLNYEHGKGFLFDDNVQHGVKNDTDEYRVVLFLDVRKKSNAVVSFFDRLFMSLVVLSPKFKRAPVYFTH